MDVNAVALVAVDRHLHGFIADRDMAIAGMGAEDQIELRRQLEALLELLGSACNHCGKFVEPGQGYRVFIFTYHSACGPNPRLQDDARHEANPEGGK